MAENKTTGDKQLHHLNPSAKWKYEELKKIVGSKLKEGDENLLAVLANAYIAYKEANQYLIDRGPVLATDVMVRQNPAFGTMKECVKIIESLSLHFGLSPKARGDKFEKEKNKPDRIDKL